jgi:hypothetical protein
MKTIKVGFVDFWDDFIPEKSLFFRLLSKHYNVELSDSPDYLFCSVFGEKHLAYDCVKVFYTGENQTPDFNVFDYAIGFDRMTFGDRFFRLPNSYLYKNDFLAMLRKGENVDDALAGKSDFCSFVYSNNNASPERGVFFDLLSRYKQVSSGGRYRNNVGGSVKDKLAFQQKHKFSIAFENSSYPGYTTEKLVQSFAAQTIPIYWGNPDVGDDFNEKAFINCHRYASFDEVVEVVKAIDNDDALFRQMMVEPALVSADEGYEEKLSQLETFLCHIIDQPLRLAKRYNRYYWGARYIEHQRRKEKAYRFSPRGIAEALYKRFFWKHRRNSKLLWKIDRLVKRKKN